MCALNLTLFFWFSHTSYSFRITQPTVKSLPPKASCSRNHGLKNLPRNVIIWPKETHFQPILYSFDQNTLSNCIRYHWNIPPWSSYLLMLHCKYISRLLWLFIEKWLCLTMKIFSSYWIHFNFVTKVEILFQQLYSTRRDICF